MAVKSPKVLRRAVQEPLPLVHPLLRPLGTHRMTTTTKIRMQRRLQEMSK
jgi:hypothetical protein